MTDSGEQITSVNIEINEDKPPDKDALRGASWAEKNVDTLVLILVIYYILWMFFTFWLLFDIWSENFVALRLIGIPEDVLDDPLIRTIGFTFAGGFLGSILYHIRVLFYFHTRRMFNVRWYGKYLTAPFEGAGLALMVLALIRGGVAMLGAVPGNEDSAAGNFAAFGIAALVGFSTRDVVSWLGRIVRSIFVPEEDSQV